MALKITSFASNKKQYLNPDFKQSPSDEESHLIIHLCGGIRNVVGACSIIGEKVDVEHNESSQ